MGHVIGYWRRAEYSQQVVVPIEFFDEERAEDE
jgi:hypothetical protein